MSQKKKKKKKLEQSQTTNEELIAEICHYLRTTKMNEQEKSLHKLVRTNQVERIFFINSKQQELIERKLTIAETFLNIVS